MCEVRTDSLRDVLGVSLSDGYLAKTIAAVSETLAPAYDELREQIRREPCINIDEPGHKDRKEKHWTWAFRADNFALSHIDKSRGAKVLEEILGTQFGGTIGSDYWGAYHKYTREKPKRSQRKITGKSKRNLHTTSLPCPHPRLHLRPDRCSSTTFFACLIISRERLKKSIEKHVEKE